MKKTFSVFLSLLVLLSSIHFKLSAHYCGTQLIDIAIFGHAKPCTMALEKGCEAKAMSCCADRELIIEGEDYLSAKGFTKQEIKKNEILVAQLEFPFSFLRSEQGVSSLIEHYSPPLIEHEIPILYQSFLL